MPDCDELTKNTLLIESPAHRSTLIQTAIKFILVVIEKCNGLSWRLLSNKPDPRLAKFYRNC